MIGNARKKIALVLLCFAFLAPSFADEKLPDPTTFGVKMEVGDHSLARKWLDAGLDPDFIGDRIGTGIMIGAWNNDVKLMELFHQRGADVEAVNRNGENALLMAAWKNNKEAFDWLLSKGANVNRDKKLQWSALHYAIFAGHEDLARRLIELGANINQTSNNGSTPLMMAAREGHEKIAKHLISLGADKTIKNDLDMTAMTFALRNHNLRIAEALAKSPEQAASIARTDLSSLPPKQAKSERLPDSLEEIMRQTRIAKAEGLPTVHLRRAFLDALNELSKAKPIETRKPVSEIGISVASERRGDKEQVRVEKR